MAGPHTEHGLGPNPKAFLIVAGTALGAWGLHAALPAYQGSILVLVGLNCLLAVSLNFVTGIAGQFSLGHAGFMAVGAYTSAWLSTGALAPLFQNGSPLGLAACLVSAGLVAGAFGYVVGLPSLRLRGDYLALVTLGFGEIIRVALLNMPSLGGARGYIGIPLAGGAPWVWGVLAATCLACWRVMESTHGRAWLSVREDEVAAGAMGVDTTRYKVRAFVASSALAGVAGALFAHTYTYLNPGSFGFMKSVEVVAMVVLGGLGSMSGSLLAACLLTLALELMRPLGDWRMVAYSLGLVLLMLLRPAGLMGRQELWQWWAARKRS